MGEKSKAYSRNGSSKRMTCKKVESGLDLGFLLTHRVAFPWHGRCRHPYGTSELRTSPLPTVSPRSPIPMRARGDTHDDEENEVDEVIEGMSIHHKVHDVDPALQCDDLRRQEREKADSGWAH